MTWHALFMIGSLHAGLCTAPHACRWALPAAIDLFCVPGPLVWLSMMMPRGHRMVLAGGVLNREPTWV
jgi:hypothetical protein